MDKELQYLTNQIYNVIERGNSPGRKSPKKRRNRFEFENQTCTDGQSSMGEGDNMTEFPPETLPLPKLEEFNSFVNVDNNLYDKY